MASEPWRQYFRKKERTAFEEILNSAIAKGLLPGNCSKQIMDSTYVLGAGAVQDTYTLIRLAISRLLKALGKRIDIKSLSINSIFPSARHNEWLIKSLCSIDVAVIQGYKTIHRQAHKHPVIKPIKY